MISKLEQKLIKLSSVGSVAQETTKQMLAPVNPKRRLFWQAKNLIKNKARQIVGKKPIQKVAEERKSSEKAVDLLFYRHSPFSKIRLHLERLKKEKERQRKQPRLI